MLDWSKFIQLPCGAERNFELLCRSLVRLRYSAFGEFTELKNQPGVEFHLQLSRDCDSLGKSGQWFGWQCKWFDLKKDGALTASQKKQIEHSLSETRKHLPLLTDWVLCVHEPLTKADQKWFKNLRGPQKAAFPKRLHIWHATDLEARLVGEAELLRHTYFGDLVLTPETLASRHDISIAPIRQRWLPECHQPVKEEHDIRRMLGEPGAWEALQHIADDLKKCAAEVKCEPITKSDPLYASRHTFILTATAIERLLKDCHSALSRMDFDELRSLLVAPRPDIISDHVAALPHRMRSRRLFRQVYATNALDDMRQGFRLLNEVRDLTCETMVAVIAEAGGGKTHLAAQVTAPDERTHRPAGMFFQAHELQHGHNLNSLASKITIQGIPVQSMEALLAALNAAGQRASRRLPLVFDGLNEAEDPRDWKPLLAQLKVLLKRYPYVLCVCTLRSGRRTVDDSMGIRSQRNTPTTSWLDFAQQALPDDGVRRLEVTGFGENTPDAIQKYFEYYKITVAEPGDDRSVLMHPLTLRIFCDFTNGERKKPVEIAAIPENLDDILASYTEKCALRIAELSPTSLRFCQADVQAALCCLGTMLWEKNARDLDEEEYRKCIKDDTRPWTGSLVQLMEQGGVILRLPGDSAGTHKLIPLFDRLGGYLIGTALLSQSGTFNFETWAKSAKTTKALSWGHEGCHPLAYDVFVSLVNQVPKRFYGRQFWETAGNELKADALLAASRLSSVRLDQATVDKIAENIGKKHKDFSELFLPSLLRARGMREHPLNANFLDSVLRRMPMAERDLLWTEWIRNNADKWNTWGRVFDPFADVARLETYWRDKLGQRTDADTLRAKWLSWMLTTTIRDLRNRVTRALYWFGRGNAAALFEMTVQAADINAPYVFERLMAASYGVAMALASQQGQEMFRKQILPDAAREIFDAMFATNAPGRTTHSQTREFARRFIELAQYHKPNLFDDNETPLAKPPFVSGGKVQWPDAEPKQGELWGLNSPFGMDFENYTIGGIVAKRRPYDFEHLEYRNVRDRILWRAENLGWTHEKFGEIDSVIANQNAPTRAGRYPGRIDRYGKKYSWIAYYEMKGFLNHENELSTDEEWMRGETSRGLDIDPSFPERSIQQQIITTNLLGDNTCSTEKWIAGAKRTNIRQHLQVVNIHGTAGPWVMLDGWIGRDNADLGRNLVAGIRSFFIPVKYLSAIKQAKATVVVQLRTYGNTSFGTTQTSAAEIPWCSVIPNFEKIVVEIDDKAKTLRVPVTSPVIDMSWESEEEKLAENVGGVVLKSVLAQQMRLVNIPQSFDLRTQTGERATINTQYGEPVSRHNTECLMFIRRDLLDGLLIKRKAALVWLIFGERTLSRETIDTRGRLPMMKFGDFNQLHFYTQQSGRGVVPIRK